MCAGLLRDYCLFVGGTLATAVWFLHHHYWFLNIQIQTHGLRFLCQGILVGLLPATLLPGLVMRPGSRGLVPLLMLAQVRHTISPGDVSFPQHPRKDTQGSTKKDRSLHFRCLTKHARLL